SGCDGKALAATFDPLEDGDVHVDARFHRSQARTDIGRGLLAPFGYQSGPFLGVVCVLSLDALAPVAHSPFHRLHDGFDGIELFPIHARDDGVIERVLADLGGGGARLRSGLASRSRALSSPAVFDYSDFR